ncbi:AsmA family protein [Methylocella silvestris]|uniref:AsmA family protein n=1 Tax=Methylocella silvestris TaxID=199596 RepID=UPI0011AEEA82|nr:AsmA family protein [Methylocella silvestris]
MRDSLTVFAVGVILVLTAALVGPYLVDWSAERGLIQSRLSAAIGRQTEIAGPIDLKLLPTPYFVVGDISVKGPDGPASWRASARKMRLEIAFAPLLRGEVEFVEAAIENPRLEVTLGPDGTPPLTLKDSPLARNVRFQRIKATGGSLLIDDPTRNRRFELAGLDLEAEAGSLYGPFKGHGSAPLADGRFSFQFLTGAAEAGEMKLKLSAEARSRGALSFDGSLVFRSEAQKLAGALRLQSADPSLRILSLLTLTPQRATFDEIEATLGEEPRTTTGKGAAELDFSAAPRASLTLSSEQIDLDLLFDGRPAAALTAFSPPPCPLVVSYKAKALSWGGAGFADIAADIVFGKQPEAPGPTAGAWLRLEARGPKSSRLYIDGAARFGAAPEFDGKFSAAAEDAGWLKPWFGRAFGAQAAAPWPMDGGFGDIPFSAIDLSAATRVTSQKIELRDLDLTLDGAHLSGKLSYWPRLAAKPARIDADLSTRSLDLAALVNNAGGAPARALGDLDGSLTFEADAVRFGAFAPPGALGLSINKTGDRIELDQLTFEGPDGAIAAASGLLSSQSARINAVLSAPRGFGITAALAKIAPGAATNALLSRADALTPIDLKLFAEAAQRQSAFGLKTLTAKGSIGGATIDATIDGDPDKGEELSLSAVLDARDSLPLMRLAGLAATATDNPGRAHIELKARGAPREATQAAVISAALGPARLSFDGRIGADLFDPSARGAISFTAPDAAPFLRAAGLVFPDFAAKTPAAVSGDLMLTAGEAKLESLKANIAGPSFAGSLAYDAKAQPRLSGELAADRLPAAALFALVLGPPEPAKGGALWSSLAFAPPAFDLPTARIALTAREAPLGAPLAPGAGLGKNLKATLVTSQGRLDLEDFTLDLAGGQASGDLKLRRSGAEASLAMRLDLKNVALDLASARGRIDASIEAAGSGRSADGLAGALAGSGKAALADLVIPRIDPRALPRIIAKFDADGHELGAKQIAAALASELRGGNLQAGDRAFDIAIASGVVTLASKPPQPDQAGLTAAFDLRRALLTQRLTLVDPTPPKGWSGAPPQIVATLKELSGAPSVEIDAAALANALANRAIQREIARIEAYEFDIHERAFFYQRLLSERRRQAERDKAAAEASAAPKPAEAAAPNPNYSPASGESAD